jgi:hypothetical protein
MVVLVVEALHEKKQILMQCVYAIKRKRPKTKNNPILFHNGSNPSTV